jgi:hypothetical protein
MPFAATGTPQGTNGTVTPLSLPARTPGAVGNILIVSGFSSLRTSALGLSDTSGHVWTPILAADFDDATNGTRLNAWWTVVKSTASTTISVTRAAGTAFTGITCDEFTVTGGKVRLDKSGNSTAGASGTPTTPSFTTGFPDELIWMIAVDTVSGVGLIDGTNGTLGGNDGSGDIAEYRVLTGRSGVSMTAAVGGSGAYDVVFGTFAITNDSTLSKGGLHPGKSPGRNFPITGRWLQTKADQTVVATGPQLYLSDLTATLSFVGSQAKLTFHNQTGSLSFIGAVVKRTARTNTGSLSFIGAQAKTTNKVATAALNFSGTVSKFISRTLTGSLGFVGSVTKSLTRALTGALSFIGTQTKLTSKPQTGQLSFVGAQSKLINKVQTATLSFIGAQNKFISHVLSSALSFVGSVSKLTSRLQTAALNFVGTFSGSHLIIVAFTSALSFVGAVSKQTGKALSGSLSFSGAISKFISHVLSGTASFIGSCVKQTSHGLAATLSFSGSVTKQCRRALTAALSFSGSITKSIRKALTATANFVGNIATALIHSGGTLFTQAFTASVGFAGTVGKMTKRGFLATLGTAGAGVGAGHNIIMIGHKLYKRITGIIYEEIN